MFTGIVEERGEVVSRHRAHLAVRCQVASTGLGPGDSLAVNGTCLTVIGLDGDVASFDLSEETVGRTTLGRLNPGDAVNLERPAMLVSRLGGHLVQGHVDGVAEVVAIAPDGGGGARMSARVPSELLRYVVVKGSIALDGVSLTVAAIVDSTIDVALIPHTLAATTFGSIREGDALNVEVDVVAKYVERLTADGDPVERQEGRTAWMRG